jgi:hypothetical protein
MAIGADRVVRIDITELVQNILARPSDNHGIVIGSLTADRRGLFTLKSGAMGPGLTGSVTILY